VQASHLVRPLDLAYPSNRAAVVLAAASAACYAAAGLLRPAPPDGDEGELVLAMDAGDRSLYSRGARLALGLDGDPAIGTRVLRVLQAVGGAGAVFSTWALARELLPDQPQLAAPAAAVAAVQPAVWQAAAEVDPALLSLGLAMATLVTASRVASRSTGLAATTLDAVTLAGLGALATLADRRLASLPAIAAAALAYDSARDRRYGDAVVRSAIALAAGGGAVALARRVPLSQPRRRRVQTFAIRALQATVAAGAVGLLALAATVPAERIRSRSDNGMPYRREAVLVARGLALGWPVFSAAASRDATPLYALPPLAVAAVGGAWKLFERGG